jgi:hypothetical protein
VITVAGTDVPVQILHRLALGVEPIDRVTRSPIGRVRVDEELPGPDPKDVHRLRIDPLSVPSPLRPFEPRGGRFKLRHGRGVRRAFSVRIHDPYRRYAPRRFDVTIWPTPDIRKRDDVLGPGDENDVAAIDEDPPTGPFIPVLSRVLRPWLLPGAAYALARATTGIRGRVVLGDTDGPAVRWVRIEAVRPVTGQVIGYAHGDERGEFLLLLGESGGGIWPPPGGSFPVDLVMSAAPSALRDPTPDELAARRLDPLVDLAKEPVPRSSNPPQPAELDNPLLRGEVAPAGYVQSATTPSEALEVGKLGPSTPLGTSPPPYVFTSL